MMFSGIKSAWRSAARGVPQGSVVHPVLFSAFINHLDDGAECILREFADDEKPGRSVRCSRAMGAIERDLDRLEQWAARTLMPFS